MFKKVSVLSGGEKSRLALAKILIQKANLIILDEPTNHLDHDSKRILQNALLKFNGTLIIVSHDVDFLRPIVNKVIEVRNSAIKEYLGSIDYYLEKQQMENAELETSSKSKSIKKEEKRRIAELRQQKSKATSDIKKNLENLENKIAELENQKLKIEEQLADSSIYNDAEKVKSLKQNYVEVQSSLEESYEKWTELTEKLETIEKEFDSQLSKNS